MDDRDKMHLAAFGVGIVAFAGFGACAASLFNIAGHALEAQVGAAPGGFIETPILFGAWLGAALSAIDDAARLFWEAWF